MAGTPSDAARLVKGSMDGASQALRRATRDAMKNAGDTARKELMVTATIVPGADRRFSNFKKAGTLRVKLRHEPGAVSVSPQGPWGIAERGAAPHGKHPGTARTQGRKAWTKGREETYRVLERKVPEEIEREVVRGFTSG